jgi:cytochrome c6
MKAMVRLVLGWILAMLLWLPAVDVAQAADLETGARIFALNCSGCHINGGNIIRRGKNLKQKTLERNSYDTLDAIAQIVTNGKGNMSAYGDHLTQEEIEAVAAYVLDQAANNWPKP